MVHVAVPGLPVVTAVVPQPVLRSTTPSRLRPRFCLSFTALHSPYSPADGRGERHRLAVGRRIRLEVTTVPAVA